jgi:hypothetical protein
MMYVLVNSVVYKRLSKYCFVSGKGKGFCMPSSAVAFKVSFFYREEGLEGGGHLVCLSIIL